jgi:hypothetical protein
VKQDEEDEEDEAGTAPALMDSDVIGPNESASAAFIPARRGARKRKDGQ